MTKNDVLTQEEFAAFVPHGRMLDQLEAFRRQTGLAKEQVNVLDWGCGRGREVLWLRERGYNAFGVDVAPDVMENGLVLFRKKGIGDAALRQIGQDGKTPFPDRFFHFTFSSQVFEHVDDLAGVARELRRISAAESCGFHVFPAHRRFVEEHVFMPFVHWLPKNISRKWLIHLFVLSGRLPKWEHLKTKTKAQKTEAVYQYTVEKTHYRRYRAIEDLFRNTGFEVKFEAIVDKIEREKRWEKLNKVKPLQPALKHLMLTFERVALILS